MTQRRQPSTPPDLPGYTYTRVLGLGGFADVFLYRQRLPDRDVAVKVLLDPRLDEQMRQRFVQEANLMAQLSQHPAIVTVHHADFAKDGRPYLVMEHCSRPGLAERYRVERMSIAECLRIGVRLASAVQGAHDVGILHRDIKPANVLTTDFGWPALTDFGIAAAAGLQEDAVGMSIPWSPPELLGPAPVGDERSDVYSLAATVYSMVAGRSPFEVAGTANTAGELVGRIERMALPSLGRPDVPEQLFEVLARAMSKKVEDRYRSATAFARALQDIETSLGLPVTALDRIHTVAQRGVDVDDDATRLRIVEPSEDQTRLRPTEPVREPGEEDDLRAAVVEPEARSRGGRGPLLAVLGVVVVALVAGGLAGVLRGAARPAPDAPVAYSQPAATMAPVVPAPQDLVGQVDEAGAALFTWVNPDPQVGDRYQVAQVGPAGQVERRTVVDGPQTQVQQTGAQTCIQVFVLRADGRLSNQPATGCVP